MPSSEDALKNGQRLFKFSGEISSNLVTLQSVLSNPKTTYDVIEAVSTSVTRLGDLLDFGQLFKAFSEN